MLFVGQLLIYLLFKKDVYYIMPFLNQFNNNYTDVIQIFNNLIQENLNHCPILMLSLTINEQNQSTNIDFDL